MSRSKRVCRMASGLEAVEPRLLLAFAPVAVADAATLPLNAADILVDVLANDTDADEDALFVDSVGQAAHGSVELVGGEVFYTPDPDYSGPDSFSYVVADDADGTDEGLVSLTVLSVPAGLLSVDYVRSAELIDGAEFYLCRVEARGVFLEGLGLILPWGEQFNSADYLGEPWDGGLVEADTGELYFLAWTNEDDVRTISVEWYDLDEQAFADLDTSATQAQVDFLDGFWAGDFGFADVPLPADAPDLLSPWDGQAAASLLPTFTWQNWADPGDDADILLDIRDFNTGEGVAEGVRPGLEADSWTPEDMLESGGQYVWELSFENYGAATIGNRPVNRTSIHQAQAAFGAIAAVDEVVFLGNHPDAEAKKWFFDDADRDRVTPKLTGPGHAMLYFDAAGALLRAELHDTTAASSLAFSVKRDKTDGDGRFNLGDLVTDSFGNVNKLDLAAVDWTGAGVDVLGACRTLILGDVPDNTSLLFEGGPEDTMTFKAGVVGDGVEFAFGGRVANLSAREWLGGGIAAYGLGTVKIDGDCGAAFDVGAGGMGNVTIKGLLGGDVDSDGAIGNVTLTGGDLWGSLRAAGPIGNITVRALAEWYEDELIGEIIGGSIWSPEIVAGARPGGGKSIGNITCTGGGIGGEGGLVEIRAAGDMGNIQTKSLRYKSQIVEEEVLDRWGDPKLDAEGNSIMRNVTYYDIVGGGAWALLDTPGKLGNVTLVGGSLGGEWDVDRGLGNISLTGIVLAGDGAYGGLTLVEMEEDVIPADLAANITVDGVAPGQPAIKGIRIAYGSITGGVNVSGRVGAISLTGWATWDEELVGGSFTSEVFIASAIGNITLKGAAFTACLEAGTIGVIGLTGCQTGATLLATQAIGNVTLRALTVAPMRDGELGGVAFGELLALEIQLGQTDPENADARLGQIKGIGANVVLTGNLPWDPALAKVASTEVTYVVFRDEFGTETETIGGDVDISGLE